ncbi:MAG TPA: hypothetical protein VHC22_24570 [Pirellulales bacterium]|nr:hypothetical protein [Pirellulales bacterium]
MHRPAFQTTPLDEVDRLLAGLHGARARWRDTSLASRVELLGQCADGVRATAHEWVAAACEAKDVSLHGPTAAEEIAAGPLTVLRYLRLLSASLSDIARSGRPRLPAKMVRGDDGRVRVPLFPTRGLYDSLLFPGYRAEAWLSPKTATDDGDGPMSDTSFLPPSNSTGTSLVLGAGNVSSIPAVDALMKLFEHNRVVLLKLNPVNDYLGDVFTRAFAPLISRTFLAVCHGGAEVGSYAAHHALVDDVHITGSLAAHNAIVWGTPDPPRDAQHAPSARLNKPITSELGNVTPWIVVPGRYSERQLDFQAENVAAMIANNASFNCIAAKLIVTCRGWPDRERFLDKVQAVLAATPHRSAYYPGAAERYRRFTGVEPAEAPCGTLPWTIVCDVDADRQPHFFREESFVCVCAETAIEAAGQAEFLSRAVAFVNERVWGTLGVGLMVPPDFRRSAAGRACWSAELARLRYGTVAVNVWPGIAYSMMCVPWGGYPGGTLADPQSGLGWVHNTYFLKGVEKSVVEAPLVARPKPLWFPTHRRVHVLARRVLDLYHRPTWWKLARLVGPALRG